MSIFSPIQSTFYSPSRELLFAGIVGIVNRYRIAVVKTSAGSITFLLLQVFNPVPQTQGFKFSPQLPKWYLDEILVIRLSDINLAFYTWIVANYQLTYLMFKAMVNYYFCCLIQVVSNAVIAPLIESCLSSCKRLNTLSIFEGLKISILFVVPLINAFESFSINQKLMPISIDTSSQIINPQIYSNSALRINRCFYFFIFIDILNLKPSSRVFGT